MIKSISNSCFLKKRPIFGKNLVKIDFNVTEERGRIMKPAIHDPSNVVFVSTTDGAGIAAVSILDKHCNGLSEVTFQLGFFLP